MSERVHPRDADVLVIGESLVDIVEDGSGHQEHPGGGPANIAIGLARLGTSTSLLTTFGQDSRGVAIQAHLADAGVHVLPESLTSEPTSSATARLTADGSATYDFDIRWNVASPRELPRVRTLHVGSLGVFLEPGASVVKLLLETTDAIEVTFDPNIRASLLPDRDAATAAVEEIAALSTVVKLSDEDAAWLYPGESDEAVLEGLVALGVHVAVMTRGSAGALLRGSNTDVVHVPAERVDVVDTIGAGDAFMAALIAELTPFGTAALDARRLTGAGTFAARTAAFVVGRRGAHMPTRNELSEGALA